MRLKLGTYGFGFLFATWIGAGIERSMLQTAARSIVLAAFLIVMIMTARRRWTQFAAVPFQQLQFEDVEAAEVSPLDLTHDGIYSRAERYIDVVNAPPEPSFGHRMKRRAKKVAIATATVLAVGAMYEQTGQRLPPLAAVVSNGRVLGALRRGHALFAGNIEGLRECAAHEVGPNSKELHPRVRAHHVVRAFVLVSGTQPTLPEGMRELAEAEVLAVSRSLEAQKL